MHCPGHFDAIAFDLDGTLIDSAPDIQHALNAGLSKAGLSLIDLDKVRAWVGDGPDVLISRALGHHGVIASGELRVQLRRAFDAATLEAPLRFGRVYKGVPELVTGLHGKIPMVVVTNKPTTLARAVLDAAGLLPLLAGVHGADAALQRKPSPSLLLAASTALGVSPARLLMVGDSRADLLCAQAAGCPAALVAWGYGGHAIPAGLDPWLIGTPQQLQQSLDQKPARTIKQ